MFEYRKNPHSEIVSLPTFPGSENRTTTRKTITGTRYRNRKKRPGGRRAVGLNMESCPDVFLE